MEILAMYDIANPKRLRKIEKTRIYAVNDGFPFLGFFFNRNGKVPCREATQRLSEKLTSPRYDDETEPEYNKRINSIIRGWKNYYYFDSKNKKNSPESPKPLPVIDNDVPGAPAKYSNIQISELPDSLSWISTSHVNNSIR